MSRATVGQQANGAPLPEDLVRPAPSRRERIVVAIRANEHANHLVRVGKRIADQCAADWTVVCVQTTGVSRIGTGAAELLSEAFRLAESLGGETVTIDGSSAAASLTHYATIRQVSRIVVGARRRRGLRRFVRPDVASMLISSAAGAQIIVITDSDPATPTDEFTVRRTDRLVPNDPTAVVWSRYVRALGITALCTALAYPVYPHFDPVNIVMVYLLGTTVVGLRLGRGPSVLSAIGNVAAFDFFFVPPRYSFYFAETQYIFTFGVILSVALVIANLMVNVRRQTVSAAARERRTATLYAMSRELGVARDAQTIATAAARHVGAALDGDAVVLLVKDAYSLRPADNTDEAGRIADPQVAEQAFRSGRSAGPGMQQPADLPCFYLPLSVGGHSNGVLVVRPVEIRRLLLEQHRLVEALAEQIALALERVRLVELATESRAAAERAALRNTLLASISHDLRGPLSTIAGAGSLVAQSNGSLDRHRRKTLGHLIEEKARDMSQLLSNVLELMRLETTTAPVRAEWQSLEELAGTAVRHTVHRLDGRRVTTNIPSDAPLAFLDGQLIVQLLANLLENAAKYTPLSSSISIGVVLRGDWLVLTVEDDGPGFGTRDPQTLFEKFERGQVEGHVSGVGLGLAICRAIATLHGGEICAMNRSTGGARFEITLPLVPAQRSHFVVNT